MSDAPGPLLGNGRAADVHDLGDGTVLRRYRRPHDGIELERRVMRLAASAGIRVPEVHELGPDHDPTTDIVMGRIDGVTMLDDLRRRPWRVWSHAGLLARLQRSINDVVAPDWLLASVAERPRRDDSLLHLDLHPMNVLLGSDGPVVIDWTNAAGGPAGFDAAITYVVMATFEVDDVVQRAGRWALARSFRSARGAAEIDAFTAAACDHRLADPGTTPDERVAVAALRDRARRRARPRA